jgi:hypothetical protein
MSEITTTQPRRGRSALLAIGLVAGFVTVLTACPPPPTPTTTTTTTTSSTTTTIAPGCVGYTPTGIGVSDNLVSVGDSITVSGFGQTSPTIGVEIKMTPIGAGTATGVLATTLVAPNGTWATAITIPSVTPGSWKVVANAVGCTGTGSATILVL